MQTKKAVLFLTLALTPTLLADYEVFGQMPIVTGVAGVLIGGGIVSTAWAASHFDVINRIRTRFGKAPVQAAIAAVEQTVAPEIIQTVPTDSFDCVLTDEDGNKTTLSNTPAEPCEQFKAYLEKLRKEKNAVTSAQETPFTEVAAKKAPLQEEAIAPEEETALPAESAS